MECHRGLQNNGHLEVKYLCRLTVTVWLHTTPTTGQSDWLKSEQVKCFRENSKNTFFFFFKSHWQTVTSERSQWAPPSTNTGRSVPITFSTSVTFTIPYNNETFIRSFVQIIRLWQERFLLSSTSASASNHEPQQTSPDMMCNGGQKDKTYTGWPRRPILWVSHQPNKLQSLSLFVPST